MNIYTLTLNPAFDIHYNMNDFVLYKENYAKDCIRNVGGKGINISRALNSVNLRNTAYIVIGDENGDEFLKGLKKYNVSFIAYNTIGRIRENITLHNANNAETRISMDNFSVSENVFIKLAEDVYKKCNKESIITITGKMPRGIKKELICDFAINLKKLGAKLVIDSKSFTLEDLYNIRPWLIKPNEEEILNGMNLQTIDIKSALDIAKKINQKGIENVIISFGAKGAVYADNENVFFMQAPEINVKSTIGAGDSMIAGFIYAVSMNLSHETCMKYAVSFGSAACMQSGTNPPKMVDIEKLLENTTIF